MKKTEVLTMAEQSNSIIWDSSDPFTHSLVIGPTRVGKSSMVIEQLIYDILKAKKRGVKVGLTIFDPGGDIARMVYKMSNEMGLSDELLYVDPLYPNESNHINVLNGEINDVVEMTVVALKSFFGKQDRFFESVQELSSRKVTFLLKTLYGDNTDIMIVLNNLQDESLLKQNVEKYRSQHGTDDLVRFFDQELFGSSSTADKYRQYIIGIRLQLESIISNEHLRAIFTGKSDIDLDEHLEKGGILAINTATSRLGRSGDVLGKFITMQLQLATFRRSGTEQNRALHYVIFEEYGRFINPDVERFLSLADSYGVTMVGTVRSLLHLEVESGLLSGKAMRDSILANTRNRIVFGGLEYDDAIEISKLMGSSITKNSEGVEEVHARFTPEELVYEIPRYHYVAKLLKDGTPQVPVIVKGEWLPKDWKEQMLADEQKN